MTASFASWRGKRIVDLVIVTLASPVAAPVALLSWLAVRFTDGAPGLFQQIRVGQDFRQFRLLKIRTMAQAPGSLITVGTDSRITAVGRHLRRWKLDEVPQFWNVARGDMSIVGPRPEIPEWVERYPEDFRGVLTVRPGLSDFASIVFLDEATLLARRSSGESAYADVVLPAKLELARAYVRAQSPWTDIWVIALTMLAMVSPRVAARRALVLAGRHGVDLVKGPVAEAVDPGLLVSARGATAASS